MEALNGHSLVAACASSVEQDIAACEAATADSDSKMQMLIRYRMERKMLLQKTKDLLRLYSGQACDYI